jgi:hypothetical protein
MPARLGVARFKLVISATREGVELYPSVEDLPGDRQKMARQALDGELATTLLIADKAGLHRMRSLMAHPEGERNSPVVHMSVASQVGFGFIACGFILLALLLWAWLR